MTFWDTLQKLVDSREVVIDRPKDSVHPRYSEYVYPFDYGYLKDTTASDGGGIDCWIGSVGCTDVSGIVTVVDPVKGDSEMKILLGCTKEDMDSILECHQRGKMSGLLMINE